ncbi:MAG: hypothetical protein MN733_14850 [Nitrososphaera sp.]|nr:hypothetical protein [Nitrososphaera sp.]
MKVEYLVLLDSEEPFCKSVSSLNSLMQAYDDIEIASDSISYAGVSFGYEVSFEEIDREHQRYFHVRVVCSKQSNSQKFRELLKSLRTILTKVSGKPPEIIWDEIGSGLCGRAYPLIHRTENLLRKLITKFMLANVGVGWTKEAIPKEVVESIKAKPSEKSQNYLYELDFIQLSNLLFKEYATGDTRKIVDRIASANVLDDLNLDELKELVACNRYFNSDVA